MSPSNQAGPPSRDEGRSQREETRIAAIDGRLPADGQNDKLKDELNRSSIIWKYEFQKRLENGQVERKVGGTANNPQRPNNERNGEESDELKAEDGLKAGIMYFKKKESSDRYWEGYAHPSPKFRGSKYPHQKLTMRETLEKKDDNPLLEAPSEGVLRYFHFPGNNMSWIEETMNILYGGTPNTPDSESRAEKILAREFWRGQMYGGAERSAPDRETEAQNGRAPALMAVPAVPIHARHMRPRFSAIPRDSVTNSGKDIAIFLPYLHWETSGRRARMVEIVNEVTGSGKKKKQDRMSDVVKEVAQVDQNPKKRTPLGEYLMAVAKVVERKDYEDDERLLREFIHAKAPLHVRRTLDQYYFPTLEDTSARDKDQVVFRNTSTLSKRVVMVDQLWLWIIDDNTIITSFPRRWGRNKPDSSGIHKSLRDRLEKQSISSIHHLALIIIDQCSRVFFDRTKPLDQRPEVMDLFSSAIGNVIQHTSSAYERFWDNLRMESNKSISVFGDRFNHRRLDINPEGIVLKEAQDIAEELRIMGRIFADQSEVTKKFKRYLMYPEGERKEQPKEFAGLDQLLLSLLAQHKLDQTPLLEDASSATVQGHNKHKAASMRRAAYEAEELLEAIESRREEILDLEKSALRACQQIEGLLSLKQQQTSIVEAKAALRRADESVKQGRTIMAFTLVTIFFLPLGFVAAFFGMNNRDINDAMWMSLDEQIRYMFVATTAAVIVSIWVAFTAWPRAICRFFLILLKWIGVWTGGQRTWKKSPIDHENINRYTSRFQRNLEQHKEKEQGLLKVKNREPGHSAESGSGTDLPKGGEARTGASSSTGGSLYGSARSFFSSRRTMRRESVSGIGSGNV